jgi:transposase-like protein
MAIVRIQLPTVNPATIARPSQCPHCGSEILQRWGVVQKPLRDTDYQAVAAYRFRCTQCGRTFRHYPQGVDRADMSQRLRCLAAIAWSMGLSLRGVGIIFSAFGDGLRVSKSSVWRAVQEKGEQLRRTAQAAQQKHRVRVLGVDGAWIRLNGHSTGVMVAVDMGDGQMVSMEVVDEHDAYAVYRWLKPLVEQLGVEVMVTDDLTIYNTVEAQLEAEGLGVERQLCRFHMLRWVGKALSELEKKLEVEEGWPDWPRVVMEVRCLVEELPEKGDERLLELWQKLQQECGWRKRRAQNTALQSLARLILQLMENWRGYRLYLTEQGAQLGVPATNNLTEQMIGNGKIRSRTVRGYKSQGGALAAFVVCAARLV